MATPKSFSVNNGEGSILIQDNNLIQTPDTITTDTTTIDINTSSYQKSIVKTGDYTVNAQTGNIYLTADDENITLTASNGNITLIAADTSFVVSSNGGATLDGVELEIGTSNTSNITLTSNNNINLSSDAITGITTDNIIWKSTDGEIILDTSPSTGNNAITIDNSGNVTINGNSSIYGYQLEVNLESGASTNTTKNGISINNLSNTSLSPEYRAVYSNSNGSNRTINALGVYSPNDPANKTSEYTGYQYGNQIITITGNEFTDNDIGSIVSFESDLRETTILSLGKIILPADNTNASSGVILTAGGIYTGSSDKIFMIKIDTTSTFTWSNNGGATWNEQYVPISYATTQRYPLSNGVYIRFSSSAGHIIDDYWTIQSKITAIVNSNIIINGSTTNDATSDLVFTGVSNNVVQTTTSTTGAPVFSNITGNIALSRLQSFKTANNTMVGYIGTTTNTDLVIQSAGKARFKITADGSLGLGDDIIDARIQASSNFNKSVLVNGNILNSNIIGDSGSGVIGNNSNLANNILNYQQNPVSTEINTGGYVIVYESYTSSNTTDGSDIYGDVFTANGDKLGSSFRINLETEYTQSHPHVAKSGTVSSDNYMVVWSSNIGGVGYGINGQLMTNGNEQLSTSADISIAASGYTPRVTGLGNGNYVVVYCVKNSVTNKYEIRYQILNSTANSVIVAETTIASSGSNHYIYPYAIGLSSNDVNRPNGFVIAYMKQVYTTDSRYQSVFKLFDADGSNVSSEIGITTTAVSNPSDVEANTDLSLSDSMITMDVLPDNLALTENGGFLVSYQTNYSSAVSYSNVVASGIRNVFSVYGNGNADLTGASVDGTTGIQTITLENVNGTFLVNDQIYLTGENGYLTEKIASITQVGTNATVVLSRDPKSISVARYNSLGALVWRNQEISSTPLKIDNELSGLSSVLPEDYLRDDSVNQYGYRSLPVIKSNSVDTALVSWNNGGLPSVYYQLINISDGSKVGQEYALGREIIGLRQVNPWVSALNTNQHRRLGYSIVYNTSSMDLNKTAIYQELIGADSYIAHFNNQSVDFVVNNDGYLGLGTSNPTSTMHIKTNQRYSTADINTDICSITMENSSNGIITNKDAHRLSFKSGNGDELARISVRHTQNYQSYTNNDLVAYFKFDESSGSVIASDNGIYNIQSNSDSNAVGNNSQDAHLIDFDVNTCWVSGKINGGLEFNGTSSHLIIPNDGYSSSDLLINSIDNITTNNFSISLWFKVNGQYVSTSTEMDLITYGDAAVGDIGSGGGFFQLYLRDVSGIGSLYPCFKWVENDGDTANEETTSVSVNDNTWHNIQLIHTRGSSVSNVAIYLDNTEIFNNDLSAKINTIQQIVDCDIYIGAGISGGSNYFRGILDEFKMFKSALSSSERAELWRYGNEIRGELVIQTAGDSAGMTRGGPGFTLDDTGKVIDIRTKAKSSFTLTGKILVTANSTSITGTNTQFLTEVKAGDILYIDNKSSTLETGGIYTDMLNQRQYIITNVISNTSLTINRIVPDVTTNTYFNKVSVRPAVITMFDNNNSMKGFMDYNGDLIIGNDGKSAIEYCKVEIRGTSETTTSKNGLLLSSTSNTNLTNDGTRINRIITQSRNYDDTGDVLQSMITSSHTGTGSDNKSKIQLWINDGTAIGDITDLVSVVSFYDSGIVNFGQSEQSNRLLGDIHLRGQDGTIAKISVVSEEPATGIYTERSEIVFYGGDSIQSATNDTRALAKILVSNDNTYPPDEQLVNGRIDLQVNNETGSNLKGLKTRVAITADGSVGIHNLRPTNPFTATPEFVDVGELINSATITGYTQSSNIITFDTGDTMFTTASNTALLRNGVIVINDGSNLTSYNLADGLLSDLNPTTYQLRLESGYSLVDNDTSIVGSTFNIYYPGMSVNKYGLVSIGDASFNDNYTTYHLSVNGNSVIRGELNLTANIGVTDSNSSNIGLKSNSNGTKLMIKDDTSNGYINLISGPDTRAVLEKGTNHTMRWETDATLLVNASCTVTLPTPTTKYSGYIFTIKNIGSGATVTITSSVNIDGSSSDLYLNTDNSYKQFQTDGVEWYLLDDSIANSISNSANVVITAGSGSNIDLNASRVQVNNNISIGGKIIQSIDTIDTVSTNSLAPIEIITNSLSAGNKSIVLTDANSNNTVQYYHCNLGSEMGETMSIFYYNANTTGSANIDFGSSNIYGGTGAGRYLNFLMSGQSVQLIYIDNSDATIRGWRIVNTGATFS